MPPALTCTTRFSHMGKQTVCPICNIDAKAPWRMDRHRQAHHQTWGYIAHEGQPYKHVYIRQHDGYFYHVTEGSSRTYTFSKRESIVRLRQDVRTKPPTAWGHKKIREWVLTHPPVVSSLKIGDRKKDLTLVLFTA